MKCALCHKKLTEHDTCAGVNKYTYKSELEHWKRLHNDYNIHIIPQGEPIFIQPIGEANG